MTENSPNAFLALNQQACEVIVSMRVDAREKIAQEVEKMTTASFVEGANHDDLIKNFERFRGDVWENVVLVITAMAGLGGNVIAEGEHNLLGRSYTLTYGVNQSSIDGTWSVNS